MQTLFDAVSIIHESRSRHLIVKALCKVNLTTMLKHFQFWGPSLLDQGVASD